MLFWLKSLLKVQVPNLLNLASCPCGSQVNYQKCCQPYHLGELAATPEMLMRSRFTAFVFKLEDYLRFSWHTTTQPLDLNLSDSPDWVSLRILDSKEQGNKEQVHFQAINRLTTGWGYLEEVSDFIKDSGRWYYLTGQPKEGVLKPKRNEPCPCGSGKKFKTCCG